MKVLENTEKRNPHQPGEKALADKEKKESEKDLKKGGLRENQRDQGRRGEFTLKREGEKARVRKRFGWEKGASLAERKAAKRRQKKSMDGREKKKLTLEKWGLHPGKDGV